MNEKIKRFININRENIQNVYQFVCDSGESSVYIFMNKQDSKHMELLTEAIDDDVSVYPLPAQYEPALADCVGEYIEI